MINLVEVDTFRVVETHFFGISISKYPCNRRMKNFHDTKLLGHQTSKLKWIHPPDSLQGRFKYSMIFFAWKFSYATNVWENNHVTNQCLYETTKLYIFNILPIVLQESGPLVIKSKHFSSWLPFRYHTFYI